MADTLYRRDPSDAACAHCFYR